MLLYWIWFSLLHINIRQKLSLLEQFRDPEEIYHAGEFAQIEDRDLTPARGILQACTEKGIGVIVFTDASYPPRLRNIAQPPLVLYYKGTLPFWDAQPSIGIVGTRKCTPYGLCAAKRFGTQIAQCGGLVVSGGAFGIDTAAMQGALAAKKTTVGVLGCGVNIAYPKSNAQLFEQVTENGCLLSEYPPGTKPNPWQFPARNRIISGICNGILVIEAPEKSGALITAENAMEQGRDVYAVPGNIDMDSCVGSNKLLQEGAMAVLCGYDVLQQYEEAYPDTIKNVPTPAGLHDEAPQLRVAYEPAFQNYAQNKDKKPIDREEKSPYIVLNNEYCALSKQEQAVYDSLRAAPKEIDEVITEVELSSGQVLMILTRLSLKGLVKKVNGGNRWQIIL